MIEDRRLRTFVTLVEMGGYTAAARQLGITQPAVTRQISELEKDLGTTLLDHSCRHEVRLTPNGEKVLHYARTILHLYGSLASALGSPEESPCPAVVPLDSITDARVWADDGGFFHLELIHKN